MSAGGNPAVYAGLLGKAAPGDLPARAVELLGGVAPFLGGLAAGAVIGGVAYVILTRLDSPEDEFVFERGPASEDAWSLDEVEDVPASVGARTATGGGARPVTGGRHMAVTSAREEGNARTGRHFRTQGAVAADVDRDAAPTRAVRGAHAAKAWAPARTLDDSATRDADYAQVAQDYVNEVGIARRMATAARGVASVLGERLGASMMEGVPVIQRADGTVADVGTSWWDAATVASGRTGIVAGTGELRVPDEILHTPKAVALVPSPEDTAPQSLDMRPEPQPAVTFSQAAAKRLADVDLALYPERRSAEELDGRQDVWAAALAALDERVEDAIGDVFADVVGDLDTLDEPDGLELTTDFIPFRMPAGHPEVVDTESYVDYLIRQEFTRNPSNAVRRNAREYLHVIEGGTAGMLKVRDVGERSGRPRGKHFRKDALPLAMEA